MIQDKEQHAQNLCARQNIKLLSVDVSPDETCLYVKAITRDQYGVVWRMSFKGGEHNHNERVLKFSLFDAPEIPLCVIDDVAQLHVYMRDREQRGLAVDPVAYGGVQ